MRVSSAARTVTPLHRRPLAGPLLVIIGLHIVGWGSLLLIIAPQHLTLGADASGAPVLFGIGLGFAAYGLGMRHAFDADHIAAIDNTTRRLAAAERPATTVGFWFSLGHSSVVVILCALLALGVKSLSGQLDDEDSTLHTITSVIGPTVSGLFLILIGVLNLTAVIGMIRIARRRTATPRDPQQLDQLLRRRGVLSRLVDRTGEGISSPRRMYLVGFLFGLGFDTATEIGLLVLAGTASAYALPWYAVLTLPVLFTAGMCALDTAQGIVMRRAYSWAGAIPRRALAYNVAVTTISLVIAFAIGVVELSSVAAAQLTLDGPVAWLGTIDLSGLGFALTGLVLTAWLCLVLAQSVASRRPGRPAVSPSESQYRPPLRSRAAHCDSRNRPAS